MELVDKFLCYGRKPFENSTEELGLNYRVYTQPTSTGELFWTPC